MVSAKSNHGSRAARALAAVLLAAMAGAWAPALAASAAPSQTPQPLADRELANETFEGLFPGGTWAVSDSNAASSTDYWANSSFRAHLGAGSAYAAGSGSHLTTSLVMSDNFEGLFPGSWSVADNNGGNGLDYWGTSTYRNYTGNYSIWSAQVGTMGSTGRPNTDFQKYDTSMNATVTRVISLSSYSSASLEFYYWMATAGANDFLMIQYDDSGGVTHREQKVSGNSGGWVFVNYSLPTNINRVGFLFASATSNQSEGVYIDDVKVWGNRIDQNAATHRYDNDMAALMYRTMDATGYASARIDYWYWIDSEPSADYLEAMYYTDAWYPADYHDGNSSGWRNATAYIPAASTRFGFRFTSNDSGTFEGAYLDDIHVIGSAPPPTCGAAVNLAAGVEQDTIFIYDGTASGGKPPLTWNWSFGDSSGAVTEDAPHVFQNPGYYNASVTATDSLGQTCTAFAPQVFVDYDLSSILLQPAVPSVTEGRPLTFDATTPRGRALDFTWALSDPACGVLTPDASGHNATLAANPDAGGMACVVNATYRNTTGEVSFTVRHEVASVSVSPTSANLIEAHSMLVSGYDAYGHSVDLSWSSDCGAVAPPTGPNTTFTPSVNGGSLCTVTATAPGGPTANASLSIQHELSTLRVSPAAVAVTEGREQAFSAVDIYNHKIAVTWSVAPATCGVLSTTSADTTTLNVSSQAGATSCSLSATTLGYNAQANITVVHDDSSGALFADVSVLAPSSSVSITAKDAFNHAIPVDWAANPAGCGSLSPANGATSTLTLAAEFAGSTCSVTGTTLTYFAQKSFTIDRGTGAVLLLTFASPQVVEGEVVDVTVSINQSSGVVLDLAQTQWTTTCEAASPALGATTRLQVGPEAGGTSCVLTARLGSFSVQQTVDVLHAAVQTVTITSRTNAAGKVELTATAKDARGHTVTPTSITWTAACGQVEGTGAKATYTPPPDLAGAACAVTASAQFQGAASSGVTTINAPMSPILIGAAAGVPALAAIAGLLLFRRRRRAKPKGEDPAEPKP